VPALVAALRRNLAPAHAPHLHKGATSQDVIDTSLVMRLRPVLDSLDDRLAALAAALDERMAQAGDAQVMGRTRMQDALLIPLAHRFAAWRAPLAVHRERIAHLRPRLLVVQLGGPVGMREAFEAKGDAVVARVAAALGLAAGPCWHTAREPLAELASLFSLISGSLGKLGADVAIMAQNPVAEAKLRSGGSSSAMAHKSNPVAAEILVSLARFNASLLSAVHHAVVHENERSGAAWTLEWLSLPQMAVAAGASLRIALTLLADLDTAKR
jgi:3-carboxy-cis,cis-muconate cycloisomerase